MKNIKIMLFIFIIVVFAVVLRFNQTKETQATKPLVAMSTFSLYDIATHIANDTLDIFMILPFGVDPHSFEPTPKLMSKILKSKLIVYSGAGLEPWISGFDFHTKTINMSEHVSLLNVNEHHHNEEDEHDYHHGVYDPHYWLDIGNMKKATILIANELINIAPNNKELYEKNRDAYMKMLNALDTKYKSSLSTCQKHTIIVNHNAFSYLSKNYGFEVEALSGLSPEAQPSAKMMVKLIEHVKEYNLTTVFFESFVSDKAIKSIANEAKVKADVLQPLGNITADEANSGSSYEDIMLSNLEKISKSLECQ